MTPLERLRRLVGEGPSAPSTPSASSCPACPDCPGPSTQRELTDEQLQALLDECGGDVAVAAYQALLYKSKHSGLTLASGLRLPDQSAYYQRLSRLYRPRAAGTLRRVDEGGDRA